MQININQQLKERLVGMAVLLFFGVIVIPWVLDGERPDSLNADNKQTNELSLPSPEGLKAHEINLAEGEIKVVPINPPKKPTPSKEKVTTQLNSVENNSDEIKTQTSTSTVKNVNVKSNESVKEDIATVKQSVKQTTDVSNSKLKVETTIQLKNESSSSEKLKPIADKVIEKERPKMTESQLSTAKQVEIDPVTAWTVQLGSFSEKTNAERMVKQLKAKEYPAFVNRYQNDAGKILFRVRVGTEKDRKRADKLQSRLNKSGFNGKVLTHP